MVLGDQVRFTSVVREPGADAADLIEKVEVFTTERAAPAPRPVPVEPAEPVEPVEAERPRKLALKAASDITENLERPLREIREIAERRGDPVPQIEVALRTGDSPSSQRAALLKRPPQILVTTPESLYLMLTAEKSRALLGQVRSVIVDEIHALARDKRGVHLALSLQRLEALNERRPARTGLSATQRPLEEIARLLVGAARTQSASPNAMDCCIIDEGHRRALDLELELPDRELEAVASTEQLGELMDRIATHVQQHRTTLVFVNTRRLSERLAHLLSERLGPGQVAAHHGSLSKERRLRVEQRLRAGELRP
jgi:ATP-dependent Lhr-like helicase